MKAEAFRLSLSQEPRPLAPGEPPPPIASGPVADPGRMLDAGYCPKEDIERLWAQKTRLDGLFDSGRGDLYRRAREQLYPSAPRRGAGQSLGNRAGEKLKEIVDAVGGLDGALRAEEEETCFMDVCGAPGAWSHFLFGAGAERGARMRGFGFSLRDGTNPLSCTWYPELTGKDNFTALWGADGTGDVCSAENVADVVGAVGRRMAVVVADGGFGVESAATGAHMENYQEIVSGRMLLAETLVMLGTICQGGCFVCKIFDAFSHVTVGLLFVVASLFEEAWIVKPHHSRVVNSERYLVGKGFRGTQRPCFDRVQRAVETAHSLWPVPGTAGAWSGLAPLHVIAPEEMRADAEFLASVQAMTVTLCRRQASALEEVMDRALQLQSSGESKMKRQRVRKKQGISSICCW